MRSHVVNADAGFAYIVRIIYRNPVKQNVSIIDCRVIIRRLGMRLKVHEFHAVVWHRLFNDNNNCMQSAARRQPTNRHSLADVSCQRWTRPMTSFIKTLRLTATGFSLVHSHSMLIRCSCTQLLAYMLLSPMSKVGLTVKTFIEIMRCRILNCRLFQWTSSFTSAVPLRASTRKYSPNSTWLVSTRLDNVESSRDASTWLDTFDVSKPMHFGCVELVEQHSSTRSTRRARQARFAT